MPVILDPDGFDLGLDPGMRDVAAASDLLILYDARRMRRYPVSTRINPVANDDASLSGGMGVRHSCCGSLLFANSSAFSSASAAFTGTSGSTPVPSQFVFEIGFIARANGTPIMKWSSM